MYDFNDDIWMCHSFGGICYNITAYVSMFPYFCYIVCVIRVAFYFIFYCQQPAINVLREIQKFLEENPTEIITIFIEDYVTSQNGLTKVFNESGLIRYMFPSYRMPKEGAEWPLITDMVTRNQRLVVFTSKSSKEASEGFAYEWTYVVENQCTFRLITSLLLDI